MPSGPDGQGPASIRAAERLLHRLAETPMDQHEVSDFLKFSPSGGRKYTRWLVQSGAVQAFTVGKLRKRFYKVADPAAAFAWIARLHAADEAARNARALPKAARAPRALPPGVHLMQDDVPFSFKRAHSGPAWREPLVAALFGPAGTAEPPEPAQFVPDLPPAQPAGPDPANELP